MYDIHSNSIPRGLAGGFFVYNALGDMEIYFADHYVIDLFECDSIKQVISKGDRRYEASVRAVRSTLLVVEV